MYRNGAEKLFFSFRRNEDLRFALNDAVRVTAGPHVGKIGAVISPVRFEPQPSYMIELATGPDVEVSEDDLALVEEE